MATRAKKATSTALTVWEQEMADTAKMQAKAEKPGGVGKSINFKNSRMMIDDAPVPDDEIEIVVLASMYENQFFPGTYNPNEIQIPTCYAFGDRTAEDPEEGMAPHAEAEDPQADTCADCENNVMGSAAQGRGKACKNVRQLVVMSADALEDAGEVKGAEVRRVKIPVTSTRGWGTYVRQLAEDTSRPFWAVVTKMKCVPDAKVQFRVTFEFVELIEMTQEMYDALKKKVAEAEKSQGLPYVRPEQVVKPTGRAAKAMAKVAGKQATQPAAKAAPAAKKVPAKKAAPAAPAPAAKKAGARARAF